MEILSLKAREILDSKNRPTCEVEILTKAGTTIDSAPSGVSKGEYEAVEIEASKAIKNIQEIIAPQVLKKDFSSQEEFDNFLIKLDGTENKSFLGANAVLPVSLAFCRSLAKTEEKPLWKKISEIAGVQPRIPKPMVLCMEGGKHGKGGMAIQEFLIIPRAHFSFSENWSSIVAVFNSLKKILEEKNNSREIEMGLEGGFIPALGSSEKALFFLNEAIGSVSQKSNMGICLDVAASEFFQSGIYNFESKNFSSRELGDFYQKIVKLYGIDSIEDPFDKQDLIGWGNITGCSSFLIVGDDLTATNTERIKIAQEKHLCNAVIIKPNQVGTVSEAVEAARTARNFGWKVIVSHRGGETQDDFIADLAVGLGADFLKSGAPSKPERMAKYNRLAEVEKVISNF